MSNDCCPLSRRELLRQSGLGLGSIALGLILAEERNLFAQERKRPRGRAKSVILLWMGGGPTPIDTFDAKPDLGGLRGKPVPESIAKRIPKNNRLRLQNLMECPFGWSRYGQSGLPVSTLFRETARHADDLCVIRSMSHESVIHT